jgi:hypothetical protein
MPIGKRAGLKETLLPVRVLPVGQGTWRVHEGLSKIVQELRNSVSLTSQVVIEYRFPFYSCLFFF